MEKGINTHPYNGVTGEYIQNMYYVRMPMWTQTFDYHNFVSEMDARGIWIEAVLDNQAYRELGVGGLPQFKKAYPTITWLQIGNEWDNKQGEGTGSGYLSNAQLDSRVRTARQLYGVGAYITLGAVATVEGPVRIRKLKNLKLCNAIAGNVYGFQPVADFPYPGWGLGIVASVYDSLASAVPTDISTGKPILEIELSEWGAEREWFTSAEERAEYYGRMLVTCANVGFSRCAPYCLTMSQEPKLGLLDENENATLAYAAVNDAPLNITPAWGSAKFDALFNYASELYGLPYVFGGKYIARDGGLDCSGFVVQGFRAMGIDIGNPDYMSAQGIYNVAAPVKVGQEQVGDIITFKGTYDTSEISHIGVVKDPIQHIMVDTHTGPGLNETYYYSAYWSDHFYAFGRLV